MPRTLGLDLGIASVGWCLFDDDSDGNPIRIRDIGSFVFDQIENPKSGLTENIDRRQKRLMRRQRRRRVRRLEDARALFQKQFGLDFFTVLSAQEKHISPFDIKVKGLTQKLTPEELMIALYHYLKYRGYKSNRKIDAGDESDKKILSGISSTREQIAAHRKSGESYYVSQYLIERMAAQPKENQRLHNTSNDYVLTVARDMYLEEIQALLDRQIGYGVIDDSFKNRYIELFTRQRDFSEGPDASSKYHVSLDERIGLCDFDGKKRAAKDSMSAVRFVLLSSLNNLRFKESAGEEYRFLNAEQIVLIEKAALEKKELTYSALFKLLGMVPYRVKGLSISRKEYRAVFAKFCQDENIVNGNISSEQYEKLNQALADKLFSKAFFKNSELVYGLRKNLASHEEAEVKPFVTDERFYDDVASILLVNKTDARILEACKEKAYPAAVVAEILKQKNVTKTIELSLDICRQLIPLMEEGNDYDKALKQIGYNHSAIKHAEKIGYLPDIDTALKNAGLRLTNPVVKHTLVQLRNIINAISATYGCPDHYSIELTRELGKNFQDRQSIRLNQLDNQETNIELKTKLMEKYPDHFHTIFDVSKRRQDMLRYKLFVEQRGMSPYTNKPIKESDIFDDNLYQIDHILPYSQSFDDSYNNKVLVETEQNQNKKNQLPLEYLTDSKPLRDFIAATPSLPREKVTRLLAKDISDDFTNKDFEDSSYIATLAKTLINYYLLPEGESCFCTSGRITEKLRELWGLSGKTHSYRSSFEKHYSGKFLSDYAYDSFEVDEKKENILFHFVYREKEQFDVALAKKAAPKGRALALDDQRFNEAFDMFVNEEAYFHDRFHYAYHEEMASLYKTINYTNVNVEGESRKDAGMEILGRVWNEINKDIMTKDRSNDLHHALDAAVIGCVSHSTIVRLTKFFQNNENLFDATTGELNPKLKLDLPYPHFNDEVLARVYERDQATLFKILNALPQYQSEPACVKNVHVMLPARSPEKNISGAISKETLFGKDEKTGRVIKRIPVDKLTKPADLDGLLDKDGGNKAVYEACIEWLKLPKATRPAFPKLAKKGTLVRSVRILQPTLASKEVDLSGGRYADNSDNIRVNVYQKKDGDKRLYFVPIYYYQLTREKIRKEQLSKVAAGKLSPDKVLSEPLYTIMWKRDADGSTQITQSDLDKNYTLKGIMPRYSLIEIHIGDKTSLCYSGGVTVGQFEVYSVLGDNYDLISSGIVGKDRKQNNLTISTISDLKIRSISVLGKVS
jgi:CRISPR-associated endonuclease Csn1